ncbi:MAG TPA: NAD(P)H-hydrate epimerase [Sedimentibacter sp.]|jgi:NAD(P)H-hydrate epimerase|nr:NAD(P)H-hydrate epimerase [Sedimentibacter sp.]HOG63776.1 NAD(P)H-hydrate epimerase [Sedimentibacter sp.]
MESISCQEMKEMDSYAINTVGIPSIVLMENAALKVINNIDLNYNNYTVVCGRGNNGGDGLAIARHLIIKGKKVRIYIAGDLKSGTEDFNINLNILKNLKAEIINIKDEKELLQLKEDLSVSDITIDALFGIGLKRNIEGLYLEIIKMINNESKQIISVDIPSGIDGDTGKPMGICVKADKTVTFHKMKKGLLNCGNYTGEIIVEDIGIPNIQF